MIPDPTDIIKLFLGHYTRWFPKGVVRFRGSCYKRVKEKVTWYQAERLCRKMGGHLAAITSKEENDFVLGLCNGKGQASWLGGREVEGKWQWLTGEPFEFKGWFPGEPSNPKANYMCTIYKGGKQGWNDTHGTDKFSFVCEWSGRRPSAKRAHYSRPSVETVGAYFASLARKMIDEAASVPTSKLTAWNDKRKAENIANTCEKFRLTEDELTSMWLKYMEKHPLWINNPK